MVDQTAIVYDILFETTASKDLATLNVQLKTATDALSRMQKGATSAGKAASEIGRAYGKSGQSIQNASYQIADFAVQVSNGAGVTRALSQQLPQLLAGFGAFGAVAGAAVAILVPLGQALFDIKDYGAIAAKAMEDMAAAQSVAKTSLEDLSIKYGDLGLAIRKVADGLAKMDAEAATRAIQAQAQAVLDASSANTFYVRYLDAMKQSWNELTTLAAPVGQAIGEAFGNSEIYNQAENSLSKFRSTFNLTTEQTRIFGDEYLQIQRLLANGQFEEAATMVAEFKNQIALSGDEVQTKLIPVLDALLTQLKTVGEAAVVAGLQVNTLAKTDYGNLNTPGETTLNKVGGSDSAAAIQARKDAAAAARKAVSDAASAARKAKSDFEAFNNSIERGVTPLQRLQDKLRQAAENFARFHAQMTPEQIAAYNAYVVDLNAQIDKLAFKQRWDDMEANMQAAADAMTPLQKAITDVATQMQDAFSSGLTEGIMAFVDGTKSAQEAFKDFALTFLKQITQMIVQATILYAIQSALGMAGFGVAPSQAGAGIGGILGGIFGRSGVAPQAGGAIPSTMAAGGGVGSIVGTVIPSTSGARLGSQNERPMVVNVRNELGRDAEVRTRKGTDGSLDIEVVRKVIAADLRRGGNDVSRALQQGYGIQRVGR